MQDFLLLGFFCLSVEKCGRRAEAASECAVGSGQWTVDSEWTVAAAGACGSRLEASGFEGKKSTQRHTVAILHSDIMLQGRKDGE